MSLRQTNWRRTLFLDMTAKPQGDLVFRVAAIHRGTLPNLTLGAANVGNSIRTLRLFGLNFSLVSGRVDGKASAHLRIHTPLNCGDRTVRYSLFPGSGHQKRPWIRKDLNSSFLVRQSPRNGAILTVRETQVLDSATARLRVWAAWLAARIVERVRPSLPHSTMMYEKFSGRYEESASVFFEHLHERGHQSVYFVLSSDSPDWHRIPARLMPYVLRQHSMAHYYRFFRTRTFIGTEVPDHAMDLRNASSTARAWSVSDKVEFVFLQHGVMYMLALSSDNRQDQHKGHPSRPFRTRVVVSSELEAEHFMTQAGFDRDDLLLSGLPKFDFATQSPGARFITIMPTWRPWEYNLARTNPAATEYAAFIRRIMKAVPPDLLPIVRLSAHPHMRTVLSLPEFSPYVAPRSTLNELLQQTALLITDYSSVAFDAFYRGAAVMFAWPEKEDCMQRYGGRLLLDETSAFGRVSMTWESLQEQLSGPNTLRTAEDEQRFRRLVTHHDNLHCERLHRAITDN